MSGFCGYRVVIRAVLWGSTGFRAQLWVLQVPAVSSGMTGSLSQRVIGRPMK